MEQLLHATGIALTNHEITISNEHYVLTDIFGEVLLTTKDVTEILSYVQDKEIE